MMLRYWFELFQLIRELVIYRESLFESIKIGSEDIKEAADNLKIYDDISYFIQDPDQNGYVHLIVCKKGFESIVKALLEHQKDPYIDFCIWKLRGYSHDVVLSMLANGRIKNEC